MAKGLPRARKSQPKHAASFTDRVLQSLRLRPKADEPRAKGPKGFNAHNKPDRAGLRRFLPVKR